MRWNRRLSGSQVSVLWNDKGVTSAVANQLVTLHIIGVCAVAEAAQTPGLDYPSSALMGFMNDSG